MPDPYADDLTRLKCSVCGTKFRVSATRLKFLNQPYACGPKCSQTLPSEHERQGNTTVTTKAGATKYVPERIMQ